MAIYQHHCPNLCLAVMQTFSFFWMCYSFTGEVFITSRSVNTCCFLQVWVCWALPTFLPVLIVLPEASGSGWNTLGLQEHTNNTSVCCVDSRSGLRRRPAPKRNTQTTWNVPKSPQACFDAHLARGFGCYYISLDGPKRSSSVPQNIYTSRTTKETFKEPSRSCSCSINNL